MCTLSNHYCNIDTIDDSVTGSFQQVDLNRHLEEIAQKIEAIFVRYQQNYLLNQNKVNASHFTKLLKQWETFVGTSHNYRNGELFLCLNLFKNFNEIYKFFGLIKNSKLSL